MDHYLELIVVGSNQADVEARLLQQAHAYFKESTTHRISIMEVRVSPMVATPGSSVLGYEARAYAQLVKR